jgi:hypothetical protein
VGAARAGMDASAVDPIKRAAKALMLDLVTFRIF